MLRDRITYLDGTRLHRGLRAGIRRLLARQSFLNKINVYPAPDGETGANMGFTLPAIVDQPDTAQSHAGRARQWPSPTPPWEPTWGPGP